MNRKRLNGFLAGLFLTVLTGIAVTGCQKEEPSRNPEDHQFGRVMIYYGCGQNDLDYSLKADIREMTETEGAYVPGLADDKAIVICYHGCKTSGSYAESGTTYTIWIYREPSTGSIVRDTLARDEYTTTANHEVMNELLTNVKKKFKADHYGIVFSSHGTGWMPQGSYEDEEDDGLIFLESPRLAQGDGREDARENAQGDDQARLARRDGQPHTSFGQERVGQTDYYMDIPEMAASFPMKMDYIIFDSCLMGGVEVAWQLAGATDIIGFSQAEVLGDGFYYKNMTQRLLVENNPCAVITDTFEYYYGKSSTSVVSCVDCREMEPLAACCSTLVAKYRTQILALEEKDVQGFYRGSHPWFFDLKDVFVQAGATEEELDSLQGALDECVMYSAHTDYILSIVPVRTSCGFSTYLPQLGTTRLNDYYRTLAWNEAVGLVE